jgi:hypothetical protein
LNVLQISRVCLHDDHHQKSTPEHALSDLSFWLCVAAAGISDWEAAAAAHAAKAAKRRFNASESHKQQVMSQVAGLHRMAAAQDAGGMW